MSWQDRLGQSVRLVSPSGADFDALWRGNPRSVEKALGRFKLPGVRGEVVQDLDVAGVAYPLTIYFEGENHDLQAARFFEACKERGLWDVTHPVSGQLRLQLVTVSEEIQPVSSGNITELNTEWVEPTVFIQQITVPELSSRVRQCAEAVDAAAMDRAKASMDTVAPSALATFKAAALRAVAVVQAVKTRLQAVVNAVTAVRSLITSAIAFTAGLIGSTMGLIKTIIDLPAALITDLRTRFDYYGQVLAGASDLSSGVTPDAAGRNYAVTQEFVVLSALSGMALALVDSDVRTREEALAYLAEYNAAVRAGLEQLEWVQGEYRTATIDLQYAALGGAYPDLRSLAQATSDLLLRRAFDLAVVRRIRLDRDRTPIDIALSTGADYEAFLEYNHLSGEEVLLLPAGSDVVVYL